MINVSYQLKWAITSPMASLSFLGFIKDDAGDD